MTNVEFRRRIHTIEFNTGNMSVSPYRCVGHLHATSIDAGGSERMRTLVAAYHHTDNRYQSRMPHRSGAEAFLPAVSDLEIRA